MPTDRSPIMPGGLPRWRNCRRRCEALPIRLDAVGNTTAAIGKGFAIGSAALTAVILFVAFKEQAGIQSIDLTDPTVLVGLFLGAAIPYLFSSMAMGAIGRAAFAMIQEVRRQFREKPGILTGKDAPDYNRCIDISTTSALTEMVVPRPCGGPGTDCGRIFGGNQNADGTPRRYHGIRSDPLHLYGQFRGCLG
nr:sodium/proton-translocating pyrophosphatase [Marispirochaeta aestuarii]